MRLQNQMSGKTLDGYAAHSKTLDNDDDIIANTITIASLLPSSLVVSDPNKNLVSLSGITNQILTWTGSPTWQFPATSGTITSVTASAPLASSGGSTPNISIPLTSGTGTRVLLK